MDKITKIFRYLVLPIYWAFLTYILLKGNEEINNNLANFIDYFSDITNFDKVIHFLIFAFLGFCFNLSFPKQRFLVFIQIMLCYSLLTEILQEEMKLGRTLEFYDLIYNVVGVLSGYLLSQMVQRLLLNFRVRVSSF